MIDLRGRFPEEPAEFGGELTPNAPKTVRKAWEKVQDARSEIQHLVAQGIHPKSKRFENCWGVFKHRFQEAQLGGKCAFCETRIAAGYPGDVEHFRPKAEIREPKTRGNRDDTRGRRPRR
ncbi:MAG: hypothetical protein MI919_21760, partial [Holophagales bacterium]|nr:hypothetical protein [Holophagales bacterium]